CMSSAVAGYKRAFGEDAVPACYADLELADLLVIVGGNPAWNHPILYQRMKAAGEGRPYRRVVVVDPRRTASCEIADLHLPIAPGTDAMLFNGLLVWLADHGATDTDYLNAHCNGWEEALAAARASVPDLASCARLCDVPQADLERFFTWFAETRRTVTLYSQGINQSSSGTDKCNAIINCHLATGRVGLPGASPFSITGQPNAMGGREVGGLANQLAAHLDYDTPGARDRVRGFWDAPRLPEAPGLKAVDLFEAVHSGRIKAVWILGTNPAVSLPDAGRVREALQRCPLVIVSDCVANTDTAAFAHILLPATGWSEKDGTVTNSERCISRQRGILPPPGEARHDWWTISQVARRMGFATAFAYSRPVDIFREHAALSGFGNSGQRAFNISALAELDQAGYDALRPIRWPVTPQAPQGTDRLFADGHFSTPDGRARLLPITPRLPRQTLDAEHPVRLNTGRIRD
ncbi:MAG: molybdopterin-dependent oxidoreductase, partial [Gammaproteobacteria bacterium]|nr:molybdopterin-dependent oxidoreductase [Gammaproteobacteria bacterium]